MKPTHIITTSLLLLLLTGCTSINGTGPCVTQYGCHKTMMCATSPNCQCTDPGCYSGNGNFCLDTGTCCKAFGNMGSLEVR